MRDAYVVEEDEVLAATWAFIADEVHVLDRHAWELGVDHEQADVLMTRRLRVGVHEREEPVRLAATADELLGAVDDPLIAVAHATRPKGGQVGAGFGLSEDLPDVVLAGESRLDKALLLLLGAVHHDGRASGYQGRRR